MKIDNVCVNDLKKFKEIIFKVFEIERYLESLNLNECEAAREAYEKLVDVQIFLMDLDFCSHLNKMTTDLENFVRNFSHHEIRD